MTKEFRITNMVGLHAQTPNSLALLDPNSYVACVGAGAALLPTNAAEPAVSELFFYEPPCPASGASPSSSPRASPVLKPAGGSPGASSARLVRVNKSHCLDVCRHSSLLAVGETGGYMPRLLLYELRSGKLLDIAADQHKFGVQFLKFAPSGSHLVSLGTPQDGFVYVWAVHNGRLDLKCTNRCISEVRDLVWLNDAQFITVGVRHVKVWTLDLGEPAVGGRNVILGPAADQVFECALPVASERGAEFLVGTARGALYRMPGVDLLVPDRGKPIKSLCCAKNTLYLSTVSHIYAYENGSYGAPSLTVNKGSPALYAINDDVFYIDAEKHGSRLQRLDPVEAVTNPTAYPEHARILQRKGLQLRGTAHRTVLCWTGEDPAVVRWPNEVVRTHLHDITVADEAGPSSLLVGSLSGDLFLGGQMIGAHHGPITDAHVFSPQLSISCSRDRTVQIWTRERPDGAWSLRQTLVLTTPVLRARLCANKEGQLALVCCGANKTLYFYKRTGGSLNYADDGAPVFADLPRTLLIKAMPYDLIQHGDRVILSTNDKLVSVYDPFAADLVVTSWRPTDSNGELINLTHLAFLENGDQPAWLVGSAANKSMLAYNATSGDLVASLWGFGEPLSGLASDGKRIFGSSDVLMASELVDAAVNDTSGDIATNALHSGTDIPPLLHMPRLHLSSENSRASPERSRPTVAGTSPPVRRVFGPGGSGARSRSLSPVRSPVRAGIAVGTTPHSGLGSPPRNRFRPALAPEKPERLASEKAGADPGMKHEPLRMSSVPRLATPKDSSQKLVEALREFMNQPPPAAAPEKEELKTLLFSALNKIDGLAVFEQLAGRLEARLETKFESLENKFESLQSPR